MRIPFVLEWAEYKVKLKEEETISYYSLAGDLHCHYIHIEPKLFLHKNYYSLCPEKHTTMGCVPHKVVHV